MDPVKDLRQDLEIFFDKLGRLNFRKFKNFKLNHPDLYAEIEHYTINHKYLPTYDNIRYKFLTWYYSYLPDELICRRENCDNPTKWTFHRPNTLCSNGCRKLDGKTIGENLKQSNLKKYGVTSTAKLEKTKDKFRQSLLANNHLTNKDLYYNKEFIINNFFDETQHFELEKFKMFFNVNQPTAHIHLLRMGIEYTKTLSSGEKELQNFIAELDIEFFKNTRKVISPLELDIYLPDYNIAIEYNGLYWHSYGSGDNGRVGTLQETKRRHFYKTEEVEKLGLNLLHVNQDEWGDHRRKIWESIIKHKLNKTSQKYFARKLKLKEIIIKENRQRIKKFFDDNHLQGGGAIGTIAFGLFNGDELISCMTFGKSRYNRTQYELIRFATVLDTCVVGGASKLLSNFEKVYKPESLHTFANRRWSNGELYRRLGFKFIGKTEPNFKVFKKGTLYLMPREKFQKHKLIKHLKNFDYNMTSIENLIHNNFRLLWDSGNLSFKKEY
jgi:hypothetical protein